MRIEMFVRNDIRLGGGRWQSFCISPTDTSNFPPHSYSVVAILSVIISEAETYRYS